MKSVKKLRQILCFFGVFSVMTNAIASNEPNSLEFPHTLKSDYPRDNFSVQMVGETELFLPLATPVEMITFPKVVATFNGKNVYASNIDGIGVSFNINGQSINAQGNIQTPFTVRDQLQVSAQLVLYKALDAGQYNVMQESLLTLWFADKQSMPISLAPLQLGIEKRSCVLLNRNEKVNLQTAFQTDLLQQGSEVFGGRFSLNLQCDPNVTSKVTFFDQSDFNNRSDILNLDPTKSTAKGVGLRIYRPTGQAVHFGQTWLFSTNEQHPSQAFTVNYLNRSGHISAGTVNATATVTFTYH